MNSLGTEALIDPVIESQIQEKLAGIEADDNVRILFAVESGSRAWGFPSPDSDYDARFVYARSVDWYVSINPGRDVIELPIEGDLDINGWDIQKALGLLLKPNPVLLEWLSSPVRYRWDDDVCGQLISLSKRIAHNRACLHHYIGVGEGSFARTIDGKEQVSIKKYFYVLRPAMALRWVRMHPETIPPMNFQELMQGADLPDELTKLIEELLEKKRVTKEMGEAPRIKELDEFVLAEFERAKSLAPETAKPEHKLEAEANALLRSIVKGSDR
ncbi:MAG: nucleotidyltransferase domain-containing protein [Pseudomonadota bacterium]